MERICDVFSSSRNWGVWDLVGATGLPDGCYWVADSIQCPDDAVAAVLPVGRLVSIEILMPPPMAGSGSIRWIVVRANRAYHIGWWGARPAFLDDQHLIAKDLR